MSKWHPPFSIPIHFNYIHIMRICQYYYMYFIMLICISVGRKKSANWIAVKIRVNYPLEATQSFLQDDRECFI